MTMVILVCFSDIGYDPIKKIIYAVGRPAALTQKYHEHELMEGGRLWTVESVDS